MERIRKEQSADESVRFGLKQLTDKGEIRESRFNTLRFEIVYTVHKQLVHPGAARTVHVVNENNVWPGKQS